MTRPNRGGPDPVGRLWPPMIVATVRGYRAAWFRPDAVAGVTVAAYLVPQVMAYAVVAGLAPVTGLWAALAALVVYAVLGSSRQLSVGPESTTALLTASAIAPLAAGDAARYAALASALAASVGVICLIGRVARLGFLTDLFSAPVLTGYLAGTALTIVIGQLGKLTRVPVRGESVVAEIGSFVAHIDRLHTPTVLLAGGTLVLLTVTSRRWPFLPMSLVGVLSATLITAAFSLQHLGVQVVGSIPHGFPPVGAPSVTGHDLAVLILPSVGIALVGYTDNMLTARAFARRNDYRVDSNTELLALGAANLTSALVHGFPVSSSGSRTAIGDAVGSRTQVHSLVALATVIVVLLAGRGVLAAFPLAALGALVVHAATMLIDVREFRRIARFRRSELMLALVTAFAVLALGVLNGILIAVALSILDLVRRVARPHDAVLGFPPGVPGMHDIDDYPQAQQIPGLIVYRYDAPLCFANAEDFRRRALDAIDGAPQPVEWFLMNAEANVEIDLTAADALAELRDELASRNIVFVMAHVKEELRADLDAAGFLALLGEKSIFPTLRTAVRGFAVAHAERGNRPSSGRKG